MRKPNNLPATTSASASNYTITSAGPQGPQTYTYPHTGSWLPNIAEWTIGFERQWDLLDSLRSSALKTTYPPYNIVKVNEDNYIVELAVAGFSKKEIEVVQKEQVLTISGTKDSPEVETTYVHKGIGARNFKHTFALSEYVDVVSAELEDGILTVSLRRELPEDKKPRIITVK